MKEDKYICGGRFHCEQDDCSEENCLCYGDCIWCENKFDPNICKNCKYHEEKRYEES